MESESACIRNICQEMLSGEIIALYCENYSQGRRKLVRDPVKGIFFFFGPSGEGGPAKYLYTKPGTLSLSCKVTWS